jgi:hypothetical protein
VFRHVSAALLGLCLGGAAPASAFSISDEIAAKGIGPTLHLIDQLSRQLTPDEQFAQGGLRFLAAIEAALQARWRYGISDEMAFLPLMRLPITENPAPAPFEPGVVTALFTDVATRMEAARSALDGIPSDAALGLEIDLNDLWFDINANAARDRGEEASAVLGRTLGLGAFDFMDAPYPIIDAPAVRFDAADVAWLMAYTHLLQGISETILAYDPTAAIARVQAAKAALGVSPSVETSFNDEPFVDMAATVIGALDQQPDAARLLSAHEHFLQMIQENRRFWGLVVQETDNDREWLPNDAQQSALGIPLPPNTGQMWMAVLADGEALLNGKALVPFWRGADGQGINLKRMFTEPAPIDIVGWIQGYAAVPYLEQGRMISDQNWRAFEQMMAGDATLFILFLN